MKLQGQKGRKSSEDPIGQSHSPLIGKLFFPLFPVHLVH